MLLGKLDIYLEKTYIWDPPHVTHKNYTQVGYKSTYEWQTIKLLEVSTDDLDDPE